MYRAVLMVPTIIEIENSGTQEQVTEQAKRITQGMGKCKSAHPRNPELLYEPKIMECVRIEDPESPQMELDLEFTPERA